MSNASSATKLRKAKSKPNEDNGNAIPPLPENWDRCHAYNERKRRYCRQMPIPISRRDSDAREKVPRYCGNHRHLLDKWLLPHDGHCIAVKKARFNSQTESETKYDERKSKKDRGRRVPCPIDPSHFIFEGSIAKHVLVCPAVKQKQEAENKEYYRKGINLGGFGDLGCVRSDNRNGCTVTDLGDAKKLAYAVLRVFHFLFLASSGNAKGQKNGTLGMKGNRSILSDQQLQNTTYRDIYDALSEEDLSEEEEGTSLVTPCQSSKEVDVHSSETQGTESSTKSKTDKPQKDMCNIEHKAKNVTGTETCVKANNAGRLTHAISKHRIKAGGPRHLHQIASILGHIRREGLFPTKKSTSSSNPLIVEMGAGRGMTGLVVAGSVAASLGHINSSAKVRLCLVERSGTRGKAETRVRTAEGKHSKGDCLRLDQVDVTRVKCDLAHVDMSAALPRSKHSNTLVVAKHLCGAGTDLALKSLRNIGAIDGFVMATCCHGLCTWNEFVGRNCFLDLFCSEIGGLSTFGENEFNLLKRWTSASVLEDRPATEADSVKVEDKEMKDEHYRGTTDEETGRYPNIFTVVKELELGCGGNGLGRACQRIIDHGRCDYIRKSLFAPDNTLDGGDFNVRLLHYCSKTITPQNALIVASRK